MSKRLIYAEDAIDALTEIESHYVFEDGHDHLLRWAKNKITALPSAQPRTTAPTTPTTDTIYRQAAIDAARDWYEGLICGSFKGLEKRLRALPSAQTEIIKCKDCLMHGVCRFEQGLGLDGYCSQAERR